MRLDDEAREEIAVRLGAVAVEAGRLLQRFAGAREFRTKADGSPTTPADLAAEALILRRLEEAWPGVPAIAEETANAVEPSEAFFLVDPLDGTRDFLHGGGRPRAEPSRRLRRQGRGRPPDLRPSRPGLSQRPLRGARRPGARGAAR